MLSLSPEIPTADVATPKRVNLDECEALMSQMPPVECPVEHFFTPGLYTRQIFMPAGSLVASRIHKFEHPFVISKGRVLVHIDGGESILLEAPYTGITLPGTRRLLYIVEDCIWTTFHVTEKTDVVEIGLEITEPYEHPALKGRPPNQITTDLFLKGESL